MAYDLILHSISGRDWSLGGAGAAKRSLAHHIEMQGRDKVVALAKLVNTEVKHNASIASVRKRARSITKADAEQFENFIIAWGSWYSRNIESGQPVSNATIADLERWRSENADWTKRLTVPIPLPAVMGLTTSLTRPTEAPVGEKTSKTPWILGLIGATFALIGWKSRRR